jgi:hypothetical protein
MAARAAGRSFNDNAAESICGRLKEREAGGVGNEGIVKVEEADVEGCGDDKGDDWTFGERSVSGVRNPPIGDEFADDDGFFGVVTDGGSSAIVVFSATIDRRDLDQSSPSCCS